MSAPHEEAVREPTGEYLGSRGYTVLQAKDGNDALQVLEHYPGHVDLLLTDVIMPGSSGRELAARVAQLRPGIRVLYMSGYTEAMMARHGIDPANGFLQKPFSLAGMGRKVREVLDGSVSPDSA